MRVINCETIKKAVEKMCLDANYYLPGDVRKALDDAKQAEASPLGREIIEKIIENYKIAQEEQIPICQDTGMVVVFVEMGNEVAVTDGLIEDAINEGAASAYQGGYFRNSIVTDPLLRTTSDKNVPAIIHYTFVKGDKLKIALAPKGFGSENMGAVAMLKPSQGVEGVMDFVVNTIDKAGSNPCPPIVVGVGIGGTMEKAAQLAKLALLRPIGTKHQSKHIEELENALLTRINDLGIGPQGLGGITTALGVNIEVFPTHIAGLPVAVNINCHASRHWEVEL